MDSPRAISVRVAAASGEGSSSWRVESTQRRGGRAENAQRRMTSSSATPPRSLRLCVDPLLRRVFETRAAERSWERSAARAGFLEGDFWLLAGARNVRGHRLRELDLVDVELL